MLKTFKTQDTEMVIKTTFLKGGLCYFGEKDLQGELETACKSTIYSLGKTTPEAFLVLLWQKLHAAGIAPVEIRHRDLRYTGIKMTEISTHKAIE